MPPRHQTLQTASQLGLLLLSARKARKMSQTSLASRVGLSQPRLSHLEQNASQISVEQLMAWCSALGLEIAISPRDNVAELATQTDW